MAALLSSASSGCSTPAAASRDNNSLADIARGTSLLVEPGTLDVQNVHAPAVLVVATWLDRFGKLSHSECSGVLIHPRVVVTAGHCVCVFRTPTPEDKPSEKPVARKAVLTRTSELQDVDITGVLDKRSSCAQKASALTVVYGPGADGGRPTVESADLHGRVLPHPEMELIAGTKAGQTRVFWNNADLAAIVLDEPVPPEVNPAALPDSEVKMGDDLVMVGYGTAEPTDYAVRQSGETEVTKMFRLQTGSVLFGMVASPMPDGGVSPVARHGDSGGGCVRKENPNVLLGVITMQMQMEGEPQMTLFTSTFSQKRWLKEIIRQADLAAGTGGGVPHSDAGSTPSPPPVAR